MERFRSGPLTLVGHLAGAAGNAPRPAVVLIHGYPSGPSGTAGAVSAMSELADRIAQDMGIIAFAPRLRGIGDSEGEFSLQGWKVDIGAATAHVRTTTNTRVVLLVGFGTGGALAVCAAAEDPAIAGVAALASPADFDDWASSPKGLYQHATDVGIVTSPPTPARIEAWAREMRLNRCIEAAAKLRPRPLLVVHGSDDDLVPSFDARAIADAHTAAELRLLEGAGHRLRHDPRAMAILLGWISRQVDASVPRPA